MSWDAGLVIEGDKHYVELIRNNSQVAQLTRDDALTLANALIDAADEPARCVRHDCDQYAIAWGLCDYHAAVAR